MFTENSQRIAQGIKTTTLRPIKYKYEIGDILTLEGTTVRVAITSRHQITIPEDLTLALAQGEGYSTIQAMIIALRLDRLDKSLPRWLYSFVLVPTKAAAFAESL